MPPRKSSRKRTQKALLSFSTGETSPLIDARSDLDSSPSSCRILKNYQPDVYGEAVRRPGTQFIQEAKT